MSGKGPAFSVRFVCTDKGRHPSRELAEIFRRQEDPELLAALIANHGETAARQVYEADMIGASHARRDRRGSRPAFKVYESTGETRSLEMRWRLRCPTCRLDLQLSGPRMREIIGRLRYAGVSRVDASRLSDML